MLLMMDVTRARKVWHVADLYKGGGAKRMKRRGSGIERMKGGEGGSHGWTRRRGGTEGERRELEMGL